MYISILLAAQKKLIQFTSPAEGSLIFAGEGVN